MLGVRGLVECWGKTAFMVRCLRKCVCACVCLPEIPESIHTVRAAAEAVAAGAAVPGAAGRAPAGGGAPPAGARGARLPGAHPRGPARQGRRLRGRPALESRQLALRGIYAVLYLSACCGSMIMRIQGRATLPRCKIKINPFSSPQKYLEQTSLPLPLWSTLVQPSLAPGSVRRTEQTTAVHVQSLHTRIHTRTHPCRTVSITVAMLLHPLEYARVCGN